MYEKKLERFREHVNIISIDNRSISNNEKCWKVPMLLQII